MTCAKQRVTATATVEGTTYRGENVCDNPQPVCPREGMRTGEGYDLCRKVCQQKAHAEINLIAAARGDLKGTDVYMTGHTYCCQACLDALKRANAGRVVFQDVRGQGENE